MKWYQSAARWGLMIGVALVGIGYLASGLSGNARDEQADQKLDLSPYKDPDILAVVEDVNAEFHKAWQRDQVEMAKPADWQTIARRVSLAALGSGVSLEDMRWMESLPEESRSEALVERLLGDRRFADYWGERLARSYVGADEGPFLIFRRRRFVNWLSGELHQNRPYGEIVRSLITARGIWTENPAVNFLTVTTDSGEEGRADPIRLAARTSRAFLGMRIDCLQCHDDFLGNVTLGTETEPAEGTQHDFHQLAAFYSSVANSIQGIKDDVHPYEYQFLYEDEKELVKPAVPYQSELLEGVPESGDEFRKQLADWVTHKENMPAARAAVNRVWALVFGKPLSEPVDDIPLHGPFPPGLDRLAHDFSEHNWDLRRLIRVIVSLDAFRVESRSDEFEVTKRHENAWAVFPLIRLRPEQVAACIVQACRLGTIDRESSFIAQIQAFGDMSDFVKRYGDTGEDEFDQDAITITQRLLAMNGKLMRERTEDSPISNAAGQIRMFAKDDRHAIETAYLAALNRSATEGEIDAWLSECEAAGERGKFLEDLYWALLNSSEFTWNH